MRSVFSGRTRVSNFAVFEASLMLHKTNGPSSGGPYRLISGAAESLTCLILAECTHASDSSERELFLFLIPFRLSAWQRMHPQQPRRRLADTAEVFEFFFPGSASFAHSLSVRIVLTAVLTPQSYRRIRWAVSASIREPSTFSPSSFLTSGCRTYNRGKSRTC